MSASGHETVVEAFREAFEADPGLEVDAFLDGRGVEGGGDEAWGEGLRESLEDVLFVLRGLRQLGSLGGETRDREDGGRGKRGAGAMEVPEWVGAYRVHRLLGEGGMGSVFLVEQEVPVRRLLALKLIKRGMDTRRVLKRFEAERQVLARMEHSVIAKVFDAGSSEDGHPWFVMEYVRGVPITKFCDEKELGVEDRIRLFQRVCAGVQHAHQKGVMHRDLKPSNVLVAEEDGNPSPKIIDFGLAKVTEESDEDGSLVTLSQEGQVLGTPEYMSPEQAGYESLDLDTRTDVYSLGVMLYELLTGELPIGGRNSGERDLRAEGLVAMRRRICEEEPVLPSRRVRGLSRHSTVSPRQRDAAEKGAAEKDAVAKDVAERAASERRTAEKRAGKRGTSLPGVHRLSLKLRGDLDWICMKALEKDRERRYASASELAADLERYLNLQPIEARAPSRLYRARKFVRKYRVLVASTLLVLLSLAGGLVAALVFYAEARDNELKAANNLVAMRETVGTLRNLTGMGEEQAQHGDKVLGGWKDGFESYEGKGLRDEKDGRFFVEPFDPDASRADSRALPWYRAADSRRIYLDKRAGAAEGETCLRLEGIPGERDGATVARWVDPQYRSYVADFELTLSFRWTKGENPGVACSLQPRSSWEPHRSPSKYLLSCARSLFRLADPWESERTGRVGIVTIGAEGKPVVTAAAPDRWHRLRLRYQRLPGNKVRIRLWLNRQALPASPLEDAFEHEESLKWLNIGGVTSPVWIDDLRLSRPLPHAPWQQNPQTSRYYALTPEVMGFDEARDYARDRGGDLARLGNADTKDWIRRTFGRHSFLLGLRYLPDTPDGDAEGWRWVDGRAVEPGLWLSGQVPAGVVRQSGALGGYEERFPFPTIGEGALVAVEAEQALPALMEFAQKPTRESFGSLAGDLLWAKSAGGQSMGQSLPIASVVADRDKSNPGGYLVCGAFRGGAVLGERIEGKPESRCVAQSAGASDAFVAKYDREGQILWARVLGGRGRDLGRGVVVDGEGRVYIAGSFMQKSALRLPHALDEGRVLGTLMARAGQDIFVACLEADGSLVWLRQLGGKGDVVATGMARSKEGLLYVSAWVRGELDARRASSSGRIGENQRSQESLKSRGAQRGVKERDAKERDTKDILLACYDSEGRQRWLRRAGGPRDGVAQAVAALSDGSVVITGGFQGRVEFGRDAGGVERSFKSESTRLDEQQNNLYVARYLANGDLAWVRHHAGIGGRTMGHALVAGREGSFYLAGAVDQTLFLGGFQGSFAEHYRQYATDLSMGPAPPDREAWIKRVRAHMSCSSVGWVDAFLAKYDQEGRAQWVSNPRGEDGSNIAYGLALAKDGSVLMTGRVQGACVFGLAEPRQCLRSSFTQSQPDLFVASFRPENGHLRWVRTARGPGANWGTDLTALDGDRVLVVGGFHGPTNFGEGEPKAKTLVGGAVFMAAFREHGSAPLREAQKGSAEKTKSEFDRGR